MVESRRRVINSAILLQKLYHTLWQAQSSECVPRETATVVQWYKLWYCCTAPEVWWYCDSHRLWHVTDCDVSHCNTVCIGICAHNHIKNLSNSTYRPHDSRVLVRLRLTRRKNLPILPWHATIVERWVLLYLELIVQNSSYDEFSSSYDEFNAILLLKRTHRTLSSLQCTMSSLQ